MADLAKTVFEKIDVLKQKYGVQDHEIAQGIGLSKSSYSRIRNGITNLTLETLSAIAAYFNLPPYYFLFVSEQLNHYSVSTQLKICLEKLQWDYERLAVETGISIFRFMEFDQGANPNEAELQKIAEVLKIHSLKTTLDPREHAIKLLLAELGLEERKIANILQYIGQNKAPK